MEHPWNTLKILWELYLTVSDNIWRYLTISEFIQHFIAILKLFGKLINESLWRDVEELSLLKIVYHRFTYVISIKYTLKCKFCTIRVNRYLIEH